MKVFLQRIVLICISVFVSIRVVSWVVPTYFFDKFIYYKSTEYGYPPPKNVNWSVEGKRAEDLIALDAFKWHKQSSPNVLGATSDNRYTIVIIGDSFVWGQGVRNEDRFAYILEKKLNTIMPSRVISLGVCGDDVFDYYLHYRDVREAVPNLDLFIFSLVENDLMYNPSSSDEDLKRQLIATCQKPTIIFNGEDKSYGKVIEESYDESFGNECVFRKIMLLLPKTNALYIAMDYPAAMDQHGAERYLRGYIQPFIDSGYSVINPNYQAYIRPDEYSVSKREGHPSVKMNRVYADVLFKEIQNTASFKTKKAAYLLGRN